MLSILYSIQSNRLYNYLDYCLIEMLPICFLKYDLQFTIWLMNNPWKLMFEWSEHSYFFSLCTTKIECKELQCSLAFESFEPYYTGLNNHCASHFLPKLRKIKALNFSRMYRHNSTILCHSGPKTKNVLGCVPKERVFVLLLLPEVKVIACSFFRFRLSIWK